jgi:hypothetical protein
MSDTFAIATSRVVPAESPTAPGRGAGRWAAAKSTVLLGAIEPACLGILLLLVACGGDTHNAADTAQRDDVVRLSRSQSFRGDSDLGRYELLGARDVARLSLRLVRTVPLGTTDLETPASIPRAKIAPRSIVVVDEAARRLRAYSRLGRSLFSVPIGAGGAGLRSAVALAYSGDTIFVLDIDEKQGVVTLDSTGHRLGSLPIRVSSSTVDYVAGDSGSLVATIMTDRGILDDTAGIVSIVDREGHARTLGCAPDPLYRESVKNAGLFQYFRFFGVSTLGRRTYCRQPITPVVQILDEHGRPLGTLRRAPPFYKRPPDVSKANPTNKTLLVTFRSQWTEHTRFFPYEAGFVSFYTVYDANAGRDRYFLFACDSASGTARCRSAESPGMPLDFIAPDTLIVVEPLHGPRDIQKVNFYHVQR